MINTLLFIVHPNFALDAWMTRQYLKTLTRYYNRVLAAIRSHKGPTLVTVMPPYSLLNGTADLPNKEAHETFLRHLSTTPAIICHDEQYTGQPLGTPAWKHIDEMFLTGTISTVAFGGGYFQSCLRDTWQNFKRKYQGFCADNNIAVHAKTDLILMAGPVPKTLDDTDPRKTYISWE